MQPNSVLAQFPLHYIRRMFRNCAQVPQILALPLMVCVQCLRANNGSTSNLNDGKLGWRSIQSQASVAQSRSARAGYQRGVSTAGEGFSRLAHIYAGQDWLVPPNLITCKVYRYATHYSGLKFQFTLIL